MTHPEILTLKGDELNEAVAKMLGMCWHEWREKYPHESMSVFCVVCKKCKQVRYSTPDFPNFASSLDTFHAHVVPWLEEKGLFADYAITLCEIVGMTPYDKEAEWHRWLIKASPTDHCHAALMAFHGGK